MKGTIRSGCALAASQDTGEGLSNGGLGFRGVFPVGLWFNGLDQAAYDVMYSGCISKTTRIMFHLVEFVTA